MKSNRSRNLALAALCVLGLVYAHRLNPDGFGTIDIIVVVVLAITAVVLTIRGVKA